MDKKWQKLLLAPTAALKRYHDYEIKGLENIPSEGGCIIACNHSLITYDILMLMSSISRKLNRTPYCLVDSFLVRSSLQKKILNRFGAIEANHKNARKILSDEHILVIAPGGMREFLKPYSKRQQVIWHDRKGFARLAIDMQCPIILAACPAADEIYRVQESILSDIAYSKFKFPIFFATGVKGTPFPYKVKLKHNLSSAIQAPKKPKTEKAYNKCVDEFHAKLVEDMKKLMAEIDDESHS